MHIYHGTVICCDDSDRVCSYLVEDRGRILYTGDTLPPEYGQGKVTELGQRVLIPAFTDSHMHFSSFAFFHGGINISDLSGIDEILHLLKNIHDNSRDDIVFAYGLSPHSVREGRLISLPELDKVLPRNPAALVKYDGHGCVINSILLRMIPSDIAGMRGYDAHSGEMSHEAGSAVLEYVTGSVSLIALVKNMIRAYDYMVSRGFGMIHSAGGIGYPRDLDVDLERWVARGIRSGFQTRLFFQTLKTEKVHRRKLLRIGGCFSTALDGSFGSMTAALHKPYRGQTGKGVLFHSDDDIYSFCRKANREGLQIALHARGDAAFDQAAGALDAALRDFPREDHRHGIIHACLPTEKGMDLCARRGIQILLQPAFLKWPQEPYSYLHQVLGDRADNLNPLKTLQERGILISGGSDAPSTPPDALHGIFCACNHPQAGESLSAGEALKLFTLKGSKSSFDEERRGSLEPGKTADMVILSRNPLSLPAEKLNSLSIEKTILKGRTNPPHNYSAFLTLLRGIFSRKKV